MQEVWNMKENKIHDVRVSLLKEMSVKMQIKLLLVLKPYILETEVRVANLPDKKLQALDRMPNISLDIMRTTEISEEIADKLTDGG